MKGYAPLGEGRGRFREAAETIRASGFQGWLVSENYYTTLSAVTGRDFLELAKRDISAIRKYFKD